MKNLHKVKFLVLPHRGIATHGKPTIIDIQPSPGLPYSKEHVLHIAASALAPSGHALADAVCNWAEKLSVPYDSYGASELYPGLGVETKIADINYLVGGRRLMEEKLVRIDALAQVAQDLSGQGKTVLFVAVDSSLAGIVVLEDPSRVEIRPAIDRLHRNGITVVLAGDDHASALASVAGSLGIERYVSERTQQEISEYIDRLRGDTNRVAAITANESNKSYYGSADHLAESLEDFVRQVEQLRIKHARRTRFTREESIYRFVTFAIIALVLFPIFDLYIRTIPALSAGILVSLAIQLGSYLVHNH